MNKTDEALKLCVEALPNILFAATERDKKNRIRMFDNCVYQAQEALDVGREALADHVEQSLTMVAEPVKYSEHYWLHEINNARADGYERGYAAGKAEPVKQEPVAWGCRSEADLLIFQNKGQAKIFADKWELVVVPLYAAPVDMPQAEPTSVDVKAIGDALLFLVERCNEQGFYSPIKQPIVQTALAAIRARGEK